MELKENTTRPLPDSTAVYDLGRKRVASNIDEIMADDIWKETLLDKWVYMHDSENDINTFVKHIYNDHKLLQIVISDRKKLFCDGVYRIYKVRIVHLDNDVLDINPEDFTVLYNSVSLPREVRYIDKLLEDGYISEGEHEIFGKKESMTEFAKNLCRIK